MNDITIGQDDGKITIISSHKIDGRDLTRKSTFSFDYIASKVGSTPEGRVKLKSFFPLIYLVKEDVQRIITEGIEGIGGKEVYNSGK